MCRISLTVCALALCLGSAAGALAQARVDYGYPPPQFEPPPPSGIGAVVVGYSGIGLAGLYLVTIPTCYAKFYPWPVDERACAITSVALAGVALSVGIPSLVVGLRRRERYKAWRARQLGGGLSPWVMREAGAGVRYALRF